VFRSIPVRWLSSYKQNKTNKLPSFTNRCWSVGKRNEVVRLGNEVVVFRIVQGQTVQKDYAKSIVQGQPSLKDYAKFPIYGLVGCLDNKWLATMAKYSQSWYNAHVQASPLC
jgi:hypothetical protein